MVQAEPSSQTGGAPGPVGAVVCTRAALLQMSNDNHRSVLGRMHTVLKSKPLRASGAQQIARLKKDKQLQTTGTHSQMQARVAMGRTMLFATVTHASP